MKMDVDDHEPISPDKGDEDHEIGTKKPTVKKSRDGSYDSESEDSGSDSDSDVEDPEEDSPGHKKTLDCVSDDDDEEEEEDEAPKWTMKDLIHYHRALTRCTLMESVRHERLILDPGSGIYLIDGDSLLLEVISTKSLKNGQQLHLFYLIEIFLHQLQESGGRVFEIVFFQDMAKIWGGDVLMNLFREAAIQHLSANCSIKVRSNWSDPFCPEWLDFLQTENPSFIFVHNGFNRLKSQKLALMILSYQCLANHLNIAFTDEIKKQASNLSANFIKSLSHHAKSNNMDFIKRAWGCLRSFLCSKAVEIVDYKFQNNCQTLRDVLFVGSISCYWNDLGEDERKSERTRQVLTRWCYYFAIITGQNFSKRSLLAQITTKEIKSKLEPTSVLYNFLLCILRCMAVSKDISTYKDPQNIADVIDYCLFHKIFESDSVPSFLITDEVESRMQELYEFAKSNGIEFEADKLKISSDHQTSKNLMQDKTTLIELQSRLSDEFAGEMKKKLDLTDSAILNEANDSDDELGDISLWKSGERLKDEEGPGMSNLLSKTPHLRKRQLRDIQKYYTFVAMYGKSLEKSIEPTMITKTDTNVKNKENKKSEKIQQPKQQQKSKKQGNKKNMKETIIEENKKKILEENKKKVSIQWKTKKSEIEGNEDTDVVIKKVRDFIHKSGSLKIGYEDPFVYLLQLQYDKWKGSSTDDEAGEISYAAELVQTLQSILQRENTSESLKIKVIKYYLRLGFKEVAANVTKTLADPKKASLKISDKCPIGMPYNIFQMKFMGHLLKRQERSDPDPRVTGFIPDTWQRELLDVVDKNESAVIVAPTSSGKTFCSFYCMEKVLRESDTNIVVYVSPTKALGNQVQASVYARYKKNMPAGTSLVGVFTRDFQHNVLTSQILVTVPQCLEILLLSPQRQQWVSNISYVIFDEVHCIGGEHGGEVWEHLITSIRCPFLALSATVGNPEYFHSWLRCVNKFKEQQMEESGKPNMKFSVKLVIHKERYSDIQTNIYLPEKDKIVETHPCVFLNGKFLSSKGFPSPLSLSPKEAHELWEAAMLTFQNDLDQKSVLEKWNPESYFGDNLFITKQTARAYETSLKEQIQLLVKNDPLKAKTIISCLQKLLLCDSTNENDEKKFKIPTVSETEFDIYSTFPSLIEKLKFEKKLPVIIFMNNRDGIERLALKLASHVKKKLDGVKSKMSVAYAKQEEASQRIKNQPTKKKNRDSDGEEIEDHMQEYLRGFKNKQNLLIQKNENECKFITPGALSVEEYEDVIMKCNKSIKKCLPLGIGYHHPGLNARSKQAVEILFRSEYAQVVLSTATLAQGIHMPCKSVVFVGDDYYVDALIYRQMSGRSGRRGFDNLGNVIFYGMPIPKISKLIKADISKLEGQFPINCSIVLRLLLFVAFASEENDAHKKAMTVLSHPFIAHQASQLQEQLRYYFLFVTDFLIRQALIDEKGIPLGFSSLVSRLHHHEPGNLAFVSILQKGIFHDLCKPSKMSQPINFGFTCQKCSVSPIPGCRYVCQLCPYQNILCSNCYSKHTFHKHRKDQHMKTDFKEIEPNLKFTYSEATLRTLVNILAHIFCTKRISKLRLIEKSENLFTLKRKPVKSKILLERLDKNVSKAISVYNNNVETIFSNYLGVVSRALPKNIEAVLPFSKKSWIMRFNDAENEAASAVDYFARLSGCTNTDVKLHCNYTEEVHRILPSQIYMNYNFIPALPTYGNLNAYALDFFKHGNLKAIHLENWLQHGEVYDLLNEFRLLIKTISNAFDLLGPEDTDDHVVWAFKHLRYEYADRFSKAFDNSLNQEKY